MAAVSVYCLRATCDDVSPSVLSSRLAELRALSLVELAEDGYRLTEDGKSLREILTGLDTWAEAWAKRWRR